MDQSIRAYQIASYSNSQTRLAMFRQMAINSQNNANPDTRVTRWKDARHWTLGGYAGAYMHGLHAGTDGGKTPVWVTHHGEYFRNESDAHDIRNDYGRPYVDHSGWYTDTDAQEMAIGIIAYLPHGRVIAGYRWTSNDERVYFPEVFTGEKAAKNAALMADEHARVFAESAREDAERFDEAQTIAIDIEDALEELRRSFALRNHKKRRQFERDSVSELIEKIRDHRETLATTYKGVL